jgi:signal transduction histidine kinase
MQAVFSLIILFLLIIIFVQFFQYKKLQAKMLVKQKEYKKRDRILLHQNKMAAMGEMIANIAHQWRQPLSAISTAASAMKLQKELNILSDETFDYSYEMIMKNTDLLSDTINNFKEFFIMDKEKSAFNLKQTIEKNITLIQNRLANSNIQVIMHLQDDLNIYGFKNEFMQVMINLLNNAIDALKIKSIKEEKIIFIENFTKENSLIIKIYDNADGINPEIMHKLFEPYFTTKHQSQGTGIGLFMAQEILVNHMNGSITCKNASFEVNKKEYHGALFEICLPIKS